MRNKLRSRLTYANVAATLALFLALGGSAYATLRVTGANVVDGSLTGADIRNGSLTGADIRNKSLTGPKIKNLTRANFRNGRLLTGGTTVSYVSKRGTIDNNGFGAQSAECPAGKLPVGGGFSLDLPGTVYISTPSGDSWIVQLQNGKPGSPFDVIAVCSS
jgi:hypothetical protein